MNTETQYEKMYNDLVAGLEKMHRRNVKRTSSALKSLLIIPTFFLIMLFMTQGSKTIFLVLWIASMFVIAGVLIVIEYQDYLLRQMFSQVGMDEPEFEQAEEPLPTEEVSKDEALVLAEQIRQSIQQRSPEFDSVTEEAEEASEEESTPADEEATVSEAEAEPVPAYAEVEVPEEAAVQEDKEEATV